MSFNIYVLAVILFLSSFMILLSGIPIWSGLVLVSFIFTLIFSPDLISMFPTVVHGSIDSFALLAVPLFILLSAPIAISDCSKDLYETLHKWLYKIPGGLGIASMLGCGIFAALCGSSAATAAAMGAISIPEMRKHGYSPSLATGIIAHAGTFGILIPPSITMILYGIATETSISKCFIAGVIPGLLEILLTALWLIIVFYYRKLSPAKQGAVYYIQDRGAIEFYSWKERFKSLTKVLPFVFIIFGIMGALYGGWATPSESAAVGAVLSIIFVFSIYRIYQLKYIKLILTKTLNESTMILMIMVGALLFAFVSSLLYTTQTLGNLILAIPVGKWGTLFFINILLLILGCFIPPAAVILMIAPLLYPVITGLGFDPIWFAVLMTINLEIGLVTPPVGLNLYIVKGIAPDVPMHKVLMGVYPFLIIEVIVIIALCLWPELALWLPSKM